MDPLTVEKILEVHDDVIREFGGTDGILDKATLEYLVYRVNRVHDRSRKAALALFCIAAKHPFIDGNKRTGFLVAENILGREGFYIRADDDEIVTFMLGVADYRIGVKEIEEWIRERTIRSELP
jgi:death-on-curing protein